MPGPGGMPSATNSHATDRNANVTKTGISVSEDPINSRCTPCGLHTAVAAAPWSTVAHPATRLASAAKMLDSDSGRINASLRSVGLNAYDTATPSTPSPLTATAKYIRYIPSNAHPLVRSTTRQVTVRDACHAGGRGAF